MMLYIKLPNSETKTVDHFKIICTEEYARWLTSKYNMFGVYRCLCNTIYM